VTTRIYAPRVWRLRDAHYNLVGRRCTECNRAFYPPKHACPYCGTRDLVEYRLPTRGFIIYWTKLYEVGEDHLAKRPIYIALVQLGETRALLQVTDVTSDSELEEKREVELVFRRLVEDGEHGIIHYGVKARLL